jgi:penicillin-binding protein 2
MTTNTLFHDERRHLGNRLGVLQWIAIGAFSLLAAGFWVFQVAQHQKFAEMAENNHMRRLPLPAPRGVLLDRNGQVLVQNQNTFNIALDREKLGNVDTTLTVLAATTGVPESTLREALERRRREPSYRPLVLVENASRAQVIAVRLRQAELPGVTFLEVPARKYPASEMAAHLFGYVSEINEAQMARPAYAGIDPGSMVGQAGVEQAYNDLLMGEDGDKLVVVNSVGREIEQVRTELPREGRQLQLTIDADVQRAVEEGFHHFGFNGAAVLLDPNNGEVLSLVSLPAYDPNAFTGGIDRATWSSLMNDKLRPLQNRALQGTYSPGSTFKIAVAAAGLQEGVVTPDTKVFCGGGASFYGRYFQCWKPGGHGTVDLRRAIEQSCNVYFYTVGNMLGVDRIHKWASALGLGEKTGIDLPNEVSGLVPSTEWKRQRYNEKWYAGETISVAIGQGQVSVTPLSLAVMMMTVANGGTRYTPHLLKAVDDGEGLRPVTPPEPKAVTKISDPNLAAIRDGLWRVVNGAGTGGKGRIVGKDVSGKTGTAQVISLAGARAMAGKMDVRHHGWFVFFAPRDNPQIAGVVFGEHAEHGASVAPIAKYAMETYFAKLEGRPLPSLVPPPPSTAVDTPDDPVVTPTPEATPAGGRSGQPQRP